MTQKLTYPIAEFMDDRRKLRRETLRESVAEEARADLGVEEEDGEMTVEIVGDTFVCTFAPYAGRIGK